MSHASGNLLGGSKANDTAKDYNPPHGHERANYEPTPEEFIYMDHTGTYYKITAGVQFGNLRVVPKSEASSESEGLSVKKALEEPKKEDLRSNETSGDGSNVPDGSERMIHDGNTEQDTPMDRNTGRYY
jgi:hypothetical protein